MPYVKGPKSNLKSGLIRGKNPTRSAAPRDIPIIIIGIHPKASSVPCFSLVFLEGIFETTSCMNPKGHNQPQVNRPNNIGTKINIPAAKKGMIDSAIERSITFQAPWTIVN